MTGTLMFPPSLSADEDVEVEAADGTSDAEDRVDVVMSAEDTSVPERMLVAKEDAEEEKSLETEEDLDVEENVVDEVDVPMLDEVNEGALVGELVVDETDELEVVVDVVDYPNGELRVREIGAQTYGGRGG